MKSKEPMDTTEFDRQRDQFLDQAEGRAEAYIFIRDIVALMNSTNLSKAEKREALDEQVSHANDVCHGTGNGRIDCSAKRATLRGLRRLI